MSSKKEMEDAIEGKSVADMSRAKQMKSIFRMITPYLNRLDIPMVAVNHIYMEQGLYPKAIVSGGTGVYLSADNIYILGRQTEKDGTEVIGYNFIINIEKSRYVREKSKIPVCVKFEGGLSKWSKHVIKPSNGWYAKVDQSTGEMEDKKWRIKDTDSGEFWGSILMDASFRNWVKERYQVSHGDIIDDHAILSEMETYAEDNTTETA
jgi:hypothetical protein